MERQDIEVFLALAQELHFARTAQRLRVAPASISQTIKKLERRFGAPLFTRTTRRVDLTPLGRQLLDELGPAYAQVQAAVARATATGHGTTGELHLGYMSAAVARRILTLVDTFHARTPDCRVSIRETALACTGRYAAPKSTCRSCRCPSPNRISPAGRCCCPKPHCSPSPPTTTWPSAPTSHPAI